YRHERFSNTILPNLQAGPWASAPVRTSRARRSARGLGRLTDAAGVRRANVHRTACYHFATQLGSTGRDGTAQKAIRQLNCTDISALDGTGQNGPIRSQQN